MEKIKLLGLAVLMFMMTACDDWLDVNASNQVDRNELFKSELGYGEALTGIYAKMCDGALYGRELTFNVLDIMAGYYNIQYYSHAAWYKYAYAKSDDERSLSYCKSYIENMWNGIYAQIANLNSLLETIDDNKGVFSGDNYNLIKGEALGLRAYLHFDLLRLFAEAYVTGKNEESIPYVTTLAPSVTPLFTQEDALKAMLEDLEQAKKLMANDPMRLGITPATCLASLPSGEYLSYAQNISTWHNRRFRINYYAVVATMARVYLWKGDRSNALACAKEVIAAQERTFPWVQQSDLTAITSSQTDGYYKHKQDRTFATEHIFALNVTDLEELMDTYIYDGTIGMSQSYDCKELTSEERTTLYEGYTADYRYQYGFTSYKSNYLVAKFYQHALCGRYFQERLPLIRLSEMYYIAAECVSDPKEGVDYLEAVRSHRGLSSYSLDRGMSSDQLKEEILKEYKKEFIGEGQLWYYYKRLQKMDFNPNMTDVKFFTFEIPDLEQTNAGRQ